MKRKVLVTGGTVFVSKYVAQHYIQRGDEVYVLNRNHYVQPKGAILIEADRKNPGQKLKHYSFDAVLLCRGFMQVHGYHTGEEASTAYF